MIRLLALSTALLLATSCSKPSPPDENPNAGGPAKNHAANDHGERKELGDLNAFGVKFTAVQYGDLDSDKEPAFELEFASAEERITTVRGWIGTKDAKGSMKSRWNIDDVANMHGHVEVPDPIPAGSKLWIELEKDGDTVTLPIDYK